ncbi:MAG: hypothetical protein V1887_01170 [Candidatus Aenigmatarchaeota archaeon]
MRIIPTPGLSTKIAAGLDIAATLTVAQIGHSFNFAATHPAILITTGAMTFSLFKWKDEITAIIVGSLGPIQNKNSYSYIKRKRTKAIRKSLDVKNLKKRGRMLVEQQTVN